MGINDLNDLSGIQFLLCQFIPDDELWIVNDGAAERVYANRLPPPGAELETWLRTFKMVRKMAGASIFGTPSPPRELAWPKDKIPKRLEDWLL